MTTSYPSLHHTKAIICIKNQSRNQQPTPVLWGFSSHETHFPTSRQSVSASPAPFSNPEAILSEYCRKDRLGALGLALDSCQTDLEIFHNPDSFLVGALDTVIAKQSALDTPLTPPTTFGTHTHLHIPTHTHHSTYYSPITLLPYSHISQINLSSQIPILHYNSHTGPNSDAETTHLPSYPEPDLFEADCLLSKFLYATNTNTRTTTNLPLLTFKTAPRVFPSFNPNSN